MGLFDIFKKGGKKIDLNEADEINKEYLRENPEPANNEDALMRKAASLISGQKFAEGIELYKQMANDFPANKGTYLSQVGVGYFFLNDFNSAIDYYAQAYANGFDKSMSDDNIWEACEAIYKQNKDKEILSKYLQLFPGGKHTKDANKLSGN